MHGTSSSSWATFVRDVAGSDSQGSIARRTGIDQSTISRWLAKGAIPHAAQAVTFARAYAVHPLDALVAADIITTAEAVEPAHDLTSVPLAALSLELVRRNRQESVA